MALIRILEKRGQFRRMAEGEATLDNMCGSAANHFKVSPNGRLSFYKNDNISSSRIAFGFALVRRALDDVEYRQLPQDLVEEIGPIEVTPGETPLADVNQEHVDAIDVSLSRMCKLVMLAAAQEDGDVLSANEIIEQFVAQVAAGDLSETQLDKKLLESIKNTRHYKRVIQKVGPAV